MHPSLLFAVLHFAVCLLPLFLPLGVLPPRLRPKRGLPNHLYLALVHSAGGRVIARQGRIDRVAAGSPCRWSHGVVTGAHADRRGRVVSGRRRRGGGRAPPPLGCLRRWFYPYIGKLPLNG